MSVDLMLDFDDRLEHHVGMSSDAGGMSIDQDGEWDISLFDELDELGDAEELLKSLDAMGCADGALNLAFDVDVPLWRSEAGGDASSSCPDGDMAAGSLSPAHTLSSASSPASLETASPHTPPEDVPSPQSQPSPQSICSDSSGFCDFVLEKQATKRTNQASRAKPTQPAKRPVRVTPKLSIQPKPVITALPLAPKTIIIQPIHRALPVKPPPITIHPAPPVVHPVLLPQPAQVLHIQTPPAVPAAPPVVTVTLQSPAGYGSDEDTRASRLQQRMIKNRESASLSRRKKKEYLQMLETRLKVALSENAQLKNENGSLKKQLQGLISENTVLKATAPKRRAVCLMVLLVFLVFNIGPISLNSAPGATSLAAGRPAGRHLLGFSPEPETDPAVDRAEDTVPEEKALMVVKKSPFVFGPPPPCQPPVNRTKCIKMAHDLRGWVHRHEVERNKIQRMSNSHQRSRSIPKPSEMKDEVALPVQYRESSASATSELQVYYAPHRTYSSFFDELNRRGDTFYVVSFRRDHLLLPATSHVKGRRPKMSLVLPALKINDSMIRDQDFEVMMQIDCEVMDTRILHIKSASIPPFLRVNQSHGDTVYNPTPTSSHAPPPVRVLMGSA
ncbi:cyclic AMP-dependent transcription factor ATF-6 alpha [Denticeps clupeoides]|uniref:cyclic AMP-dependent transcription factor ATF-6 alpha n=1 Tax=Denticeps clupeoides TaxID=299321 RepID=UPI0010A36D6C|nr:cyclic AMP-dependent transcription factor ATF-6 alpha [Denticeps clupeoides]